MSHETFQEECAVISPLITARKWKEALRAYRTRGGATFVAFWDQWSTWDSADRKAAASAWSGRSIRETKPTESEESQ